MRLPFVRQLIAVLAIHGLLARPAAAQWAPMDIKGCTGMSFVDSGEGFLLRNTASGTELHKLVSGAWAAGAVVNVGYGPGIVKMHFTDVQHGFVITNEDKIYRTEDSGATWSPVTITFKQAGNTTSVKDIDFGSKTHGVAVGVHGDLGKTPAFVAITTDGGKTWAEASGTAPLADKVGMSDDKTIVAGALTKNDISISTDGGASWTTRKVLGKGVLDISFISKTTGFVLSLAVGVATTNEQILVTKDGGKTWTSPAGGVLPLQALIMSWVDDQNGFVGGRSSDNKTLAIARTTNGGTSWALETLPTDAEFAKPSVIMNCFDYPGPAAYAGMANGTVRLLKIDNAGGKRAARYGNTNPTTDGAVAKDAKVSGDSGTAKPQGDGTPAKADSTGPTTGGGGGCALGGTCMPAGHGLAGPGLLLLAVSLLMALPRRRSRSSVRW